MLKTDKFVEVINVKAQSTMFGSQRTLPDVLPAYYTNKKHWLSILLDGGLGQREIGTFVQKNFDLTH